MPTDPPQAPTPALADLLTMSEEYAVLDRHTHGMAIPEGQTCGTCDRMKQVARKALPHVGQILSELANRVKMGAAAEQRALQAEGTVRTVTKERDIHMAVVLKANELLKTARRDAIQACIDELMAQQEASPQPTQHWQAIRVLESLRDQAGRTERGE